MKKIIDGKKYDTTTAQHIGTRSNNLARRDFRWFDEELYLKGTGEFFLYGEGGPMTRYKAPAGDMWTSGSQIIPLKEDEAKMWVENYMDFETYESLWGPVEE